MDGSQTLRENLMQRELCGLAVSEDAFKAAVESWPRRPATGYDDRSWEAACCNHVLLTARQHGEEPRRAGLQAAR